MQVPLLEQERLVGVLNGLLLLTDGDGKGGKPDRSPTELADDGREDGAVDLVQPLGVDFEHLERLIGDDTVDVA